MSYDSPEAAGNPESSGNQVPQKTNASPATVIVRGEALAEPASNTESGDARPKPKDTAAARPISDANTKLQNRLPALADDADIGVQKNQVVVRDGQADLAFTGTLIASAAHDSAPKGKWQEYRIYETNAGKHVFHKVTRSIYADENDAHEAEIFDPSPDSMPSKLMRSARELTRSKPFEWTDAAVAFFGYDPLAKTLYRKVSGRFEEHIS